jgi:hypothetical protein
VVPKRETPMGMVGRFFVANDPGYQSYRTGSVFEETQPGIFVVKFDHDEYPQPYEVCNIGEMMMVNPEFGKLWLFFDSEAEMKKWIEWNDAPAKAKTATGTVITLIKKAPE